jgi:hypothetical protein
MSGYSAFIHGKNVYAIAITQRADGVTPIKSSPSLTIESSQNTFIQSKMNQ